MIGFSQKTKEELKYYAYGLIDPNSGELFYIGKGNGDRVFEHEIKVKKNGSDGSEKENKIQKIISDGSEVKKVIFLWGLNNENQAYVAETALINAFGCMNSLGNSYYLTNKVAGHHGGLGAMEVSELEELYGAQPIDSLYLDKYNLMVVKLNKTYRSNMTDTEKYDTARGNWKAVLKNASKADYVLAIYKSVIVGVYKPDAWYNTVNNGSFNPLAPNHTGNQNKNLERIFFVEEDYSNNNNDPVKKELLGKKIDVKSQNPIVYLYKE